MENYDPKFLEELGSNLKKIIKMLLRNKKLLRLLQYTDKDPLNEEKEEVDPKLAYGNGGNSLLRIIPIVPSKEDSTSVLTLRVLKGSPVPGNDNYLNIYFSIEVFVPIKQWIIINDNLRPYAIMGEISRSLSNKQINGLGTIKGAGFSSNYFTEEISCYIMNFGITQFD